MGALWLSVKYIIFEFITMHCVRVQFEVGHLKRTLVVGFTDPSDEEYANDTGYEYMLDDVRRCLWAKFPETEGLEVGQHEHLKVGDFTADLVVLDTSAIPWETK